jgi:hypothetical protein
MYTAIENQAAIRKVSLRENNCRVLHAQMQPTLASINVVKFKLPLQAGRSVW